MIRSTVVLTCALAAVLVTTGCGRSDRADLSIEAPESTAVILPDVARPDLSALDVEVRAHLEQAADRHEAILARVGSSLDRAEVHETAASYGALASVYHAHELHEPARVAYDAALDLTPDDPRWLYLLGHLERAENRLDDAVDLFERVRALRPDDVPTLLALANALRDLGRLDEAESVARRALEIRPNEAATEALLGRLASDRGDDRSAVEHFEAALALQPRASKLRGPAAAARSRLGDADAARRHLAARGEGNVITDDPLLSELASLRLDANPARIEGHAAFEAGDWEGARAAFERAVADDPNDAESHLHLGATLLKLGRPDDAAERFARAAALDPGLAEAHLGLGRAAGARGDDSSAADHYAEAVALAPDDGDARFNLANSLRRLGRCAEAIDPFRELAAREPGRLAAWLGHAVCAAEDGRWTEAASTLETVRRGRPASATLALAHARLLAAAPDASVRDGATARALAEQLVAARADAAHLETLAMALAEVGDFEAAAEAQRRALALDPSARAELEAYEAGRPWREPGLAELF